MKKRLLALTVLALLSVNIVACGEKTTEVAADNSLAAQDEVAEERSIIEGEDAATAESDEIVSDDEVADENSNDEILLDGIAVAWAEGKKADLVDYEEIDVVNSDYQTGILFTAKELLYDFTLYELQMKDVDENGKPSFDKKEVYHCDLVHPDMPLVLNVAFPGDLSAYGFSYNLNDLKKQYSIMVSGMDGSLVIEELSDGYPDEDVTLPFTSESEYHPEDYADLAKKGSASEADVDQMMEGVSDMLLFYQSDDNPIEYENAYERSASQEFYQESEYGTRIIHAIVWTENELMDAIMHKVGYNDYEVNYYYPSAAWTPAGIDEAKPVFVSMYVDGNGFEYYFSEDELVRRSGPEGISLNPQTNEFINSIYKLGCYYGNTLAGERNRYNLTVASMNSIEKQADCFVITGDILGRDGEGSFVIDKNTVYESESEYSGFEGMEKGESFYSWYSRAYDAILNDEDWIEFTVLLGIWDIRTTGNHVDSVCGTYWWD